MSPEKWLESSVMFCTTFPHLVPMYQRLGMKTYRGMHTDPDFGPYYALVGWMQGDRRSLFVSSQQINKGEQCQSVALCS
jgi:hypothetical protein